MKNIQLASRQTDYKILAVLKLAGILAIAGVVGWCVMPAPSGDVNFASLIVAAISVGSALFAWSVFRFIRPVRYDRDWQIAGVMLIPAFWLLLTLALDVWLIGIARDESMQNILQPLVL